MCVRDINHAALPTEAHGARPNRAIDGCVDQLTPWPHETPVPLNVRRAAPFYLRSFHSIRLGTVVP